MRRRRRALHGSLVLGLCLVACGGGGGAVPASNPPSRASTPQLTPDQQLERARQALDAGRYAEAEAAFNAASLSNAQQTEAELGLRQVYLATGRYALAAAESKHASTDAVRSEQTLLLRANALSALGQHATATALLKTSLSAAARVDLGAALIIQGKREEASTVLMSVIEDYNADRIKNADALGMALVGARRFCCAVRKTPTTRSTWPNRCPATYRIKPFVACGSVPRTPRRSARGGGVDRAVAA